MNRTLKLSLLCAGIFAAGAASGVLGTMRYNEMRRDSRRPPNPEAFNNAQMRRLTEGLDLTAEQREKLQPILTQAGEELRKLRRDSYRASTAAIANMENRILELLTPEQKERFKAMQAEQRERFRQRMADPSKQRPEGGADREQRRLPPPPQPPE